jgi:hypothetical protein
MSSLESGFARELFVEWASDSKNLVLFTERGQVQLLCSDYDFSLVNIRISFYMLKRSSEDGTVGW